MLDQERYDDLAAMGPWYIAVYLELVRLGAKNGWVGSLRSLYRSLVSRYQSGPRRGTESVIVSWLEDKGWIKVEPLGAGHGALYTITVPRGEHSVPRGEHSVPPLPPDPPPTLSKHTRGIAERGGGAGGGDADAGDGEPKVPSKPKASSKPRKRRATWRFVPEDWYPTDRHRELAKELGANLDLEAAKFRDHEFAQPRSDANRAFSNWLRRSTDRRQPGRKPPQPNSGFDFGVFK